MTAITIPTTQATDTTAAPSLWKGGLAAGAVAAVATTVVAAVARAADIPVDIGGEEIPLLGFAQLTLMATVVGVLLARSLRRSSAQPRARFVAATLVLTVLSCIPDVTADTGTASKLTLMATHLVAAAIVIPAIARRLPEHRAS